MFGLNFNRIFLLLVKTYVLPHTKLRHGQKYNCPKTDRYPRWPMKVISGLREFHLHCVSPGSGLFFGLVDKRYNLVSVPSHVCLNFHICLSDPSLHFAAVLSWSERRNATGLRSEDKDWFAATQGKTTLFFPTIIRLQVKGLLHNLTIPDVEARLLEDMGYFDWWDQKS